MWGTDSIQGQFKAVVVDRDSYLLELSRYLHLNPIRIKAKASRSDMLVSMGTAAFVLACSGVGMSPDGVSRVVQGIVTGIGFLCAGSVLKLDREREIQGLTTTAGIWMTAAIGAAVGLGSLGIALLSTVFTLIILALSGILDRDQRRRTIEQDCAAAPIAGSAVQTAARCFWRFC